MKMHNSDIKENIFKDDNITPYYIKDIKFLDDDYKKMINSYVEKYINELNNYKLIVKNNNIYTKNLQKE